MWLSTAEPRKARQARTFSSQVLPREDSGPMQESRYDRQNGYDMGEMRRAIVHEEQERRTSDRSARRLGMLSSPGNVEGR